MDHILLVSLREGPVDTFSCDGYIPVAHGVMKLREGDHSWFAYGKFTAAERPKDTEDALAILSDNAVFVTALETVHLAFMRHMDLPEEESGILVDGYTGSDALFITAAIVEGMQKAKKKHFCDPESKWRVWLK